MPMTFPSYQGLILPVVRRWPNLWGALTVPGIFFFIRFFRSDDKKECKTVRISRALPYASA